MNILAASVVILVLCRLFVDLVSSLKRLGGRARQDRLAAALMTERIQAARALRTEREQERYGWDGYRKFVVVKKQIEDAQKEVCSFYLAPHDGKMPLPAFKPGQYLTFRLSVPGQAKPIVRCYSLSDAPHPEQYRVTIKRVPPPRDNAEAPPGLSSNFFHDSINERDILDVRAPAGKFALDMTRATPVVLIGGGIGLTPMLSMANAIAAQGSKRETWLFYGVRHGQEQVMKPHLDSLARDHENIRVHVCFSCAQDADRCGTDYHHDGYVCVDLLKGLLPSTNYEFYVCGPPGMMKSITDDLGAWGVPKERILTESFGPATVKKAFSPAVKTASGAKESSPGEQVTVHFSKSGKECVWSREAGSLLELAEANGVQIEAGCRTGGCGTCQVAVRKGKVAYPHEPGYAPQEGSCLTCIGYPEESVTLDV